jgi:hypothetical protein
MNKINKKFKPIIASKKITNKELLKSIDQKVDYIISLLKEDELRFPYHQTFLDSYNIDRSNKYN